MYRIDATALTNILAVHYIYTCIPQRNGHTVNIFFQPLTKRALNILYTFRQVGLQILGILVFKHLGRITFGI